MKNRIVVPIDLLVEKYIKYGNENGFLYAENILMKYLPDDKPDGVCADVKPSKRHDFLMELIQ